ncbi:molybdopterin synthase [Halobacteriales archaeon QH_7_69_31]|nr:MAG: molybdopterin synthase [Halobacteriales archaeon QH_7_69_31]
MQVFAVGGANAEAGLDRLLAALDGRVGVVRTAAARRAGDGGTAALARGDTRYDLEDGWRAEGDTLSVRGALERLAPDHDYAAVVGDPGLDAPRVVVGEDSRDLQADEPGGLDVHADDADGPDVGADDAGSLDIDAVDVGPLEVHADDAAGLDVQAAVAAIDDAEPFETLDSLVAAVKRSASADRAGAIATFTGRVRERDGPDDDRTRYLEFEKFDDVADRTMRTIETDLEAREGVIDVRLHHRTGRVDAGEDIVFVVVLAGHRREAFRTVEDGIDRLKDEVPLFKKEVTAADTYWVHERE